MPDIDDSIIDDRRVFKAPYSWDRGKICLPLSDEQLEGFNVDMMSPKVVLARIKIMNRGVLERNTNQSVHKANERFVELAENIINLVIT